MKSKDLNFKIRCSAASQILADPPKTKVIYSVDGKEITTAKYNKIVDSVLLTGDLSALQHVYITKIEIGDDLSAGAKTYCEKWLKQKLFGRREEYSNKYTDKGNAVEEDGLNLIVSQLKLGMIYKNEERREDEFKTGEIDFIYKGIIYDNKASYSLDTFPLFGTKLDKSYSDQQQGYTSLWDTKLAKVCYTLLDTPIDILRRELYYTHCDNEKQRKALNHVFTLKAWNEAKETLFPMADKIKFETIPDEYRIKVFDVHRDDDIINKINLKSKLCARYIESLLVNL